MVGRVDTDEWGGYDAPLVIEGAVEKTDTLIVGAGLAGMATAMFLDGESLVLERESRAGGLAVTNVELGYRFDATGHWLHMRDPEMIARFGAVVPMRQVYRKSAILAYGGLVAYPFQSNLKDVPPAVRTDCLVGAMEAYGRRVSGTPVPEMFGDFVLHHFGEGIAREFMFPYNTKLWGVPPDEISNAWCQRFVPVPDLKQIIEGAFTDRNEKAGYNAAFSYPATGGIDAFSSALAAGLRNVHLDRDVVRVHLAERWVETADGERIAWNNLVSTMPLKELVGVLVDAPDQVRQAGKLLSSTAVTYYDLGLDRKVMNGLHWAYLPDPALPAYRVGCYSNAVDSMAPDGCSSVYVELANGVGVDHDRALDLVLGVISQLGEPVGRENVKVWRIRKIPYGYVIYDRHWERARSTVLDHLATGGVQSIGRYGKWVYSSMEDALVDGREAARKLA